MAFIHLDHGKHLIRSFSSATRGEKSVVKIEIEVADPEELGWLLREIGIAKKALTPPKKSTKPPLLAIEHKPVLPPPFSASEE